MIKFIFFDNLLDFIYELIELLKEDWKKFKLFVKEHKKNLIWLFIALITLQVTDLINIGNTCNKYYKKQNKQIQNGGSGEGAAAAPPTKAPAASADAAAPKDAAAAGAEEAKEKKPAADSETKNVQKKLDLFNELKGKKDKLAKNGLAGPVFSNLEGIFGAVGGIFSLLMVILTIIGILSLPVLIFIIITYCIIKKILGHLALV
jgi:uncharacterized membrane protein